MSQQSLSMPSHQFLVVAANLIQRCLIEPSRAEAKQRFRSLQGGQLLPLQTVEMEDKSLARFGLRLDYSEYRGKLNFSAFRDSLAALLANIGAALKAEKEPVSFRGEDERDGLIFGFTGLTMDDDKANLLVLGTAPAEGGDGTVLKLMYLDPDQFQTQQAQDTPA